MAKKLSKNEVALYKNWDAYVKIIDDYTFMQVAHVYDIAKKCISERIADAAGGSPDRDEKTYMCFKDLMSGYARLISLYDYKKSDLRSPGVKNILEGIYSVLNSRLKLFEESGGAAAKESPIAAEKKSLLNKSVNFFNNSANLHIKAFRDENGTALLAEARAVFIGADLNYNNALRHLDGLCKRIFDFGMDALYGFYCDAVKLCVPNPTDNYLNDLTCFYLDQLAEEREILSSILKVQADTLKTAPCINYDEKSLVDETLTGLRDLFERLEIQAADISGAVAPTDDGTGTLLPPDEFRMYVTGFCASNVIFSANAFESIKSHAAAAFSAFERELKRQLAMRAEMQTDASNNIYSFQKKVSEHIVMANEMILTFYNLVEFYKAACTSAGADGSPNAEIIKGINDTVNIKIESLNENKDAFADECSKLIDEFSVERREATAAELSALVVCGVGLWKETITIRKGLGEYERALKVFYSKVKASEECVAYTHRLEKIITAQEAALNKVIHTFKKDQLLYEVSSYEELLNYSVIRLRESESELEANYVAAVDICTKKIETILKKNNILMLRPNPHDMFVGKEHEVIIAEKNPDFNKGEIIKLMNSGYIQNDVVLLRANVIAAK